MHSRDGIRPNNSRPHLMAWRPGNEAIPAPKAVLPKAGVEAGVPKGLGVAAVPNAGVLAAPKPAPKAVGADPNDVLVAPKAGVAGCAPKAGVEDAPNTGCEAGDIQSSLHALGSVCCAA
jgi:hypothetical protein